MHICVSKPTSIGSDNGLSPGRNIVNWTLKNKLQLNLNRNSYILIHENVFVNVVRKFEAIWQLRPPSPKKLLSPHRNKACHCWDVGTTRLGSVTPDHPKPHAHPSRNRCSCQGNVRAGTFTTQVATFPFNIWSISLGPSFQRLLTPHLPQQVILN